MKRQRVPLDPGEKEILESFEAGEWKPVRGGAAASARYRRAAAASLRKDRRINIRISSRDLLALQKRALIEGLPYQTLISSILHRYAAGGLRERPR